MLFYDESGKCLKLGVHTELLENEFISLKEYEEQFGKYLKLGVHEEFQTDESISIKEYVDSHAVAWERFPFFRMTV